MMTRKLFWMNRRIILAPLRFGSTNNSRSLATTTAALPPLSPYKVLGVRRSATTDQIKIAFRKLAKQHHPDLKNHHNTAVEVDVDLDTTPTIDIAMSDILAAYETLMAPSSASTDYGDSRVAIACEVMTLDDLKRDSKRHSVYTIQVLYNNDNDDNNKNVDHQSTIPNDDDSSQEKDRSSSTTTIMASKDHNMIYRIVVHPDDSVTDFKHVLQQTFGTEWGLDQQRRKDRHGLATAWEVVTNQQQQQQEQQYATSDTDTNHHELQILGNHWFLYTYNINHGDLVHVIVRNDNE